MPARHNQLICNLKNSNINKAQQIDCEMKKFLKILPYSQSERVNRIKNQELRGFESLKKIPWDYSVMMRCFCLVFLTYCLVKAKAKPKGYAKSERQKLSFKNN